MRIATDAVARNVPKRSLGGKAFHKDDLLS
jgi:hypothetical protein